MFSMKALWIIFGSSQKTGLSLGVISMHFLGLFLESGYKIGIVLGFAKNFQIIMVCLITLLFWGVNSRCWLQDYA